MEKSYDFFPVANQPIEPGEPIPFESAEAAYYKEGAIDFGSFNINTKWNERFYRGWTRIGEMGFDLVSQAADLEIKNKLREQKREQERIKLEALSRAMGLDYQLPAGTSILDLLGDEEQ